MTTPEEIALAIRKTFQEFETHTARTPMSQRIPTVMRIAQIIAAISENPKLATKEVMDAFPEEHYATVTMVTFAFLAQQINEEVKKPS